MFLFEAKIVYKLWNSFSGSYTDLSSCILNSWWSGKKTQKTYREYLFGNYVPQDREGADTL
jgi:hypothetical protein